MGIAEDRAQRLADLMRDRCRELTDRGSARDMRQFGMHLSQITICVASRNRICKDLADEPFVAHNVNSGSRFKVIEAFATQHTPLNITLELATVETIKRFVQKRVGLAFVPRMCVREELERGALVTVPVRGLTHNRILWAAHRRGANFSPAAAAFLDLLRKHKQ